MKAKRIKRLDESVSSRIAAGEVIENPASVVKELLENALDASSTQVRVSLRQGGKARIVVEDDGIGIAFDELPLAVERFATSKIDSADDLESIGTLGYRGEALASLGAVSRLEIRSLSDGAVKGGLIRCNGGIVEAHLEISSEKGTRVQADDLFFNLPARRKFLKQAASETRKVARLLREYAVAYPDVGFSLTSDGKPLFDSGGGKYRKTVLESQWGKDPRLLSRKGQSGDVAIEAWWQPHTTGSRLTLTIFVNGRRVNDPAVRAAVSSLGPKAAGTWFLLVDVPPPSVDVNIHPAKAEVRFKNSGEIFQAVSGVAESLTGGREGKAQFEGWNIGSREFPKSPLGPLGKTRSLETSFRGDTTGAASLFARVSEPPPDPKSEKACEADVDHDESFRYFGMLDSGYLLFKAGDSLVIVDPHAAHERILYEKALSRIECEKGKSQNLSVPEALPPTLAASAADFTKALEREGFFLAEKEGQTLLTAVPAVSGGLMLTPLEMLRTAVEELERSQGVESRPKLQARWALLACKRAVKLGESFETKEAMSLWRDLSACMHPESCPHGRPTSISLDAARLGRLFGRE
ncbi:MAG: DNA mismatch repair endonuclease MutL [Thermovirgaceae bacterium]